MKKAQGLPITTIIIAAMGILVLVVVAAIFGGQIFKFGRIVGECAGRCVVRSIPAGVDPAAQFEVRADGACDPEFETKASGVYIAKGTPAGVKEVATYRCASCCIPIG